MHQTPPTLSPSASPASDNPIRVETTRFGPLEIAADRVIHFPGGLLGFPQARRFALIQTDSADTPGSTAGDAADCFYWLQNVDDARLAFVVCDPSGFIAEFADYSAATIPLRQECRDELGLSGNDAVAAAQVLVICNRVGDWLTGNLLGPLVINGDTFRGKQVVLTERRWGTRQPLLRLRGSDARTAGRIEIDADQVLRKTA